MAACIGATKKVPNTVFLNHSTDGVSCEYLWNRKQNYKFINGSKKMVSLTDPNQNKNNARYQLWVVLVVPSLAHIFLTVGF